LNRPRLILGIGELLWDLLPDGLRLGGAPANFSVMAGRLGDRAVILSRIGRDDLGQAAIDFLYPLPVNASAVQVDPAHETGRVTVTLRGSEPLYSIDQPVAWDFLHLENEWLRMAEQAGAVCFGTLAQRSPVSRQTIQALVANSSGECIRVFDANLRTPFYSSEVIQESIELATVLKMSGAETWELMNLLGLERRRQFARKGLRSAAERLLNVFPNLQLIAITRGSRGSLLVSRQGWNDHPGFPVKVADPVGAGDAFTAALVHYMLRGGGLALLNEAGNRWGAWVASQPGAMPALVDEARLSIAAAIEG
jgi:fructokinase